MKKKTVSRVVKHIRFPGFAAGYAIVSGTVCDTHNIPCSLLTVNAYDRNLGAKDTLLGQAVTDARGKYSIAYSTKDLGGKQGADLVVEVLRGKLVLQVSDVIFNAKETETKDFIIAIGASSEFYRLSESIRPLLRNRKLGM